VVPFLFKRNKELREGECHSIFIMQRNGRGKGRGEIRILYKRILKDLFIYSLGEIQSSSSSIKEEKGGIFSRISRNYS